MPRTHNLQWLLDMLIPAMNGVRQRRRYIENEWLLNYRAWQGWPSQTYALPLPDGAVHYFIPHARRAIERNVARAVKLLMPNQDWFETLPTDGESHANAEAVHTVMRYIYTKKLQTKRNISTLARCLELYNFSVLNTSIVIQRDEVWPYQKTVDPFNFYVFPDTACVRDEALLIFEDCIIPYQVYMSYVNRNNKDSSIYEYIPSEDLHAPEWPYHLVERLAYRGLTNPSDFITGTGSLSRLTEHEMQNEIKKTNETLAKQSKAFVALSKVYFRLGSEWYYAVLCTNINGNSSYNAKVVRLDEVENSPMYRWSNIRPLPGELYTNSPMDDIRVLQNLVNTSISQVESNRSQHAEPPLVMNAEGLGRTESKTFANRKVWFVDGNPNDIIKSLDVEDTSTNGIRAFQIYSAMMDKGSGGTLTEGQPGRNMPRAGFAANTLLNIALIDIEDLADTEEQELLSPGLSDVYHAILEYVPESQIFKIPGKNLQLVKAYAKTDLYGDYSFTWLGSLGFQDAQVRADKFLKFLEVLLNPTILQTVIPALQAQQQQIDFAQIIKTIYSFGLGERGLGSIIVPLQPALAGSGQGPNPLEQQQAQEAQAAQQAQQLESASKEQELQHTQQMHQLDIQGKVLDIRSKAQDSELKRVSQLQSINQAKESPTQSTRSPRNARR